MTTKEEAPKTAAPTALPTPENQHGNGQDTGTQPAATPGEHPENGREMEQINRLTDEKLIYKAMKRLHRHGQRRALYQALVRVIPKLPVIPKDNLVDFTSKKTGTRVKFRFAGLDKILESVLPLLANEGITIVFGTKGRKLIGRMVHTSGAQLVSWLRVPKKLEAADLQSELSRRRRYMVIAMIDMAAEENEGNLPRGTDRDNAPRGTRTRGGTATRTAAGKTPQGEQPSAATARPADTGTGSRDSARPAGGGTASRGGTHPGETGAAAGTAQPKATLTREAAARTADRRPAATQPAAPEKTATTGNPAGATKPEPATAKPTETRAEGRTDGHEASAGSATTAADGTERHDTKAPTAMANATATGGWLFDQNNETANEVRDILPLLSPKQAAKLRTQFPDDPEGMLREAKALHAGIYGAPDEPAKTVTPTPADTDTPTNEDQKARIEKAFKELEMGEEDQEALKTEYAGRDNDLLKRLRRTYQRRLDASKRKENT